MTEKILILDFGSQYTQLIARNVRELNIYCEIQPCLKPVEITQDIKGIILSGSPFSVNDPNAPKPDVAAWAAKVPVLAVCYGAQLVAQQNGGVVAKSNSREFGRAHLVIENKETLLETITPDTQVWMSHSDSIKELPEDFVLLARTNSIPVAAYRVDKFPKVIYGIQFHPEVTHSTEGRQILKNFTVNVCGCSQDWTPAAFIEETVAAIKEKAGNEKVVMAL